MFEEERRKVDRQIVNNDLSIMRLTKKMHNAKTGKRRDKLQKQLRAEINMRNVLANRKAYLEKK